MSIPCSTITYPRRDAWALQLQALVDKDDMQPIPTTTMSEIMSQSPLPWPVTPYDEWAPEREMIAAAKCAAYDAKQYEMYGDDEDRVMSLMCDETEVDIRLALWRFDRMDELELELKRFFELFNERRFGDALYLGWWLLEQHDHYGASYDPALLRVLKETMSAALEEDDIGDSSNEASQEVVDHL
jgi:hypothetical protein